mmetsp:Transcript_41344/g.74530  ORF Transcript_41344/g.74530 Transcript_41344/m.74530 type:complete len:769 (+) Transcript_41344:96-2402(+)
MIFKRALVALTLASASLLSLASSASNPPPPPRISIQQLRSALSTEHSGINLHQLLFDSHGILRIALGGDYDEGHGFSALRKRALSHLCDCPTFRSSGSSTSPARGGVTNDDGAITFEEALQSNPKDLQQITLPDGTVRRTLASATVGFDGHDVKGAGGGSSQQHHATALELPLWVQDNCGRDAYDSFEDLRDVVADVVDVFVERLDQENKLSNGETLEKGQNYRQILSSANHLEHFHVYTKSSTSSLEEDDEEGGFRKIGGTRVVDDETNGHVTSKKDTSTLDYHTDAGFFLSFVPAMSCRSYTTDNSSFYLKGQKEPVTFEEDEVVIMLGAGAQYWLPSHEQSGGGSGDLQKQYPFLAASHALRLSPDTHRTWYGKMHLLPSSFTTSNIDPQSSSSVKYGEVLPSFRLKDFKAYVPTSPVDGCGTTAFNENLLPTLPLGMMQKQSGRRRLQHAASPANCNNQTNFFCWHQCIDMPNSNLAEQYVYEGNSLYCLDPAKLSSSENSILDATEPCGGGYEHNSNCVGSWQETDEEIPGYKLPYAVKAKEQNYTSTLLLDTGDDYCYGGTSMYMDGFTWQGTTCVIYIFRSWVLSTPGKFAWAAIGSIIFGVALEFVLWKRRSVYALPPGARRLFLSALVYGLQLSMGYFIMLVIMTYSGPLFICTVGGMMLGHVFFNAQDSLVKQRAEKKISRSDRDEVAASETVEESKSRTNTELSSYQNGDLDASDQLEGGERKSPPEEVNGTLPPTENTKLKYAVADGATPCCQYNL